MQVTLGLGYLQVIWQLYLTSLQEWPLLTKCCTCDPPVMC